MPSIQLKPIEANVCYPLPVFQDITGQGRNAIAQARREGLRVIKRGSRKYVIGSDWIEYLKNIGS